MIVTAAVLNARSGPGTDFRVLGQVHRDSVVDIVETHGDWAYVEPIRGWVSRAYLANPLIVMAPAGLAGIINMYGEPGAPACSAGRVQLPAPLKLGWSSGSVTRVACHVKLEAVFAAVFQEVFDRGLWQLLHTFDGIFNDRSKTASQKKSVHAWGAAVDLNAATNRLGTTGDISPKVVAVFEEAGFTWGGRWSRPDPMHFQFARDY